MVVKLHSSLSGTNIIPSLYTISQLIASTAVGTLLMASNPAADKPFCRPCAALGKIANLSATLEATRNQMVL